MSNENFSNLFEESLRSVTMRPGTIVPGTVVDISSEYVIVNVGLKSESMIPIKEFLDVKGQLSIKVGEVVQVSLEDVGNVFGETCLSREKAKREEVWDLLAVLYESGGLVEGQVLERVKGGFTIDLDSVRAFLPGSLADVRPMRNPASIEGERFSFRIVKMDKRRNNVVVSRRAVLDAESNEDFEVLLDSLKEGLEIDGVVKNLTDYGAFVDIGGIDGLLHVTDMSWKRVKNPKEAVEIGQKLRVKILKFDRQNRRVSLGVKQLAEDPWLNIEKRYPVGTRLEGKVTNLVDYGCFVEIHPGIEGLVHMSEMDWTNKNVHPSKLVQAGDQVAVIVLEIDENRRRVSLGMKQCKGNPWAHFAEQHKKGDIVSGVVKSITDFGIFVGLEGDIDGLIHLSDLSWTETGVQALRNFSKGNTIDVSILSIDVERERISLGVKQLTLNPKGDVAQQHAPGSHVEGRVTAVESDTVILTLRNELNGRIPLSEFGDAVPEINTPVSGYVVNFHTEQRLVDLTLTRPSVVGKSSTYEAPVSAQKAPSFSSESLGNLIREKMDSHAAQQDISTDVESKQDQN